jgi:hypothetical protein
MSTLTRYARVIFRASFSLLRKTGALPWEGKVLTMQINEQQLRDDAFSETPMAGLADYQERLTMRPR